MVSAHFPSTFGWHRSVIDVCDRAVTSSNFRFSCCAMACKLSHRMPDAWSYTLFAVQQRIEPVAF